MTETFEASDHVLLFFSVPVLNPTPYRKQDTASHTSDNSKQPHGAMQMEKSLLLLLSKASLVLILHVASPPPH